MKTLAEFSFTNDNTKDIVFSTFTEDITVNDIEQMTQFFMNLIGENTNLAGKRVALLVPNTKSYVSLVIAINQLGGTVVPLSPQFREGDLTAILSSAMPHIIFTIKDGNGIQYSNLIENCIIENNLKCKVFEASDEEEGWKSKQYNGVEPVLDDFDRHFILFTSGSTGIPKGVVMSQEAIMVGTEDIQLLINCQENDRFLVIPPQTVVFGVLTIFCAMRYKFTAAIPNSFDIPKMVQMMKRIKVNKILSTPSILKAIYNMGNHTHPEVFESIDECMLAGEMVNRGEENQYPLMKSSKFKNLYGLSEGGSILSCDLRGKQEWNIEPNAQVKIIDDELVVKTRMIFSHYYNQPEITNKALLEDGWLKTGDLARITENNKVILIGRKKDIIKKGGRQVIPGEVEGTLKSHPSVKHTAVIGAPHDVYGEEIVAFVELDITINVDELYQYCAKQIAGYKVPDHIEIIDDIPVTSGKTDKNTLRKKYKEIKS
ncbi:class I adenylate-forming enzyme family protein [Gracilibacillus sp. D59]|uniref:class I adenylate-forming enzyme family protein n=1 Tax=Gracilibacillus sp. D59 TaxID=3457434 RepID=UPI003FCDC9A3